MSDLISVIVPVYNAEKRLASTIESILNQTYTNIELLLIDDGSQDNSGKICDDYAKKDGRVRVIHKDNEGVGYTRNRGLEAAKGDLITFVDADDTIDTNTYEDCMEIFKNNEIDGLRFNIKELGPNGELAKIQELYVNTGIVDKDELLNIYLKNKIMGSACCWMIKRNVIGSQIKFPTNLIIAEDYVFVAEIICKSKNIYFTNKAYYNYYFNEESATRSPEKYLNHITSLIDSTIATIEVLKKYDLSNENRCSLVTTSKFKAMMNYVRGAIKKELTNQVLNIILGNCKYLKLLEYVDRTELKAFDKFFIMFSKSKKIVLLKILCYIKGISMKLKDMVKR